MYKILVMDIDNTLTNQPHTVPERNLEAVRRARDAGVFVTVATGRGHKGASPIIQALDLEGPVICYGGAIIVDAVSAAPVFLSQIDNTLVQELLALAADMNVHAHLYQGDGIVCAQDDVYTRMYTTRLGLPVAIDPGIRNKTWQNVPKVLWMDKPERARELIPGLQARFEGRLKVSGSSPGFIEFNMLGVDKGTGVMRLAEHMGVAQREVAAIGDNTLDAEMLLWAGLGAAVADAQPEILAIADVVTPACADCGVAWFIDEYILK